MKDEARHIPFILHPSSFILSKEREAMRAFDGLLLALLVGAAVAASGCDPKTVAYFLMPEAREEALIKHLASADPKKEPRVAILTYGSALETRAEFIQADRQLAEKLADELKARASADDEKLFVLPQRKVEAFKSSHPNWPQMDLYQVGRALAVDYVIYLEIDSLSLYEKNSLNQTLRGRAEIRVSLAETNKPDESQGQTLLTSTYPSDARGGVPISDTNREVFRRDFLGYVAKELSCHFARFPKRTRQFVDGPSPF
jgi:hypothetical protein